ncbi:MAG: ATPase [Gammaproteobacteria bacterium]|nr:MAG: ATPase [Gammaproteobacteria bacterium]
MELNWSTFALEIFNFLVLVWILKRFLYKPVLNVITRRRETIENQLAEARQLHTDADALKERYEHRLSDWEQERLKALDKLRLELEENRLRQLENLKAELAREAEKNQVARSRQDKQLIGEIEQRALQQGAEFASRLLSEAAGPELENRLFDLLLDGLSLMPADQISDLSNKWGESPERILVTSVYPLTDEKQHQLEETLCKATDLSAPVLYEQDAKLLAGLNITIGAWVLQLNVRDELQGFMEFAHVED